MNRKGESMTIDAIRKAFREKTRVTGKCPDTMFMNRETLSDLICRYPESVLCEKLDDGSCGYSIIGVYIEVRNELETGKVVM
jgi:hypothetical protein